MTDVTPLTAFVQALTPAEHAMLTPFMHSPEPLPEETGWSRMCPPTFLAACLSVGVLRREIHGFADLADGSQTFYTVLSPTLEGWAAWAQWHRP